MTEEITPEMKAVQQAAAAAKLPRDRYLRNRPFLVVYLSRRPMKAPNVRTEVKGWGDEAGRWQTTEQPLFVDRVNATHLRDAAVIIDVLNGTVVKNQYIDTPNEDVVSHYLTKFRSHVTEAMDIWLTGVARQQAQAAAKQTPLNGTFSIAE